MSQPEPVEPTWRDYRPSWPNVLLFGFGQAALLGGCSYAKTGRTAGAELALIWAVLFCVFYRWVYPRFRHLTQDTMGTGDF